MKNHLTCFMVAPMQLMCAPFVWGWSERFFPPFLGFVQKRSDPLSFLYPIVMAPTSPPFEKLRHVSREQQEAIDDLQSQFWLDRSTLLGVIEQFDKELKAGLMDDRSSDLNMIPSFVTGMQCTERRQAK